jgi:plastocyanin
MISDARRLRAVFALCGAAALAACGGDGNSITGVSSGPPTPTPTASVSALPSLTFAPGSVAIVVGGTVTFDFGVVAHDVFFDNAPAGAPANITEPRANKSVTLTFATKGTYQYNCHIHPGMRGTITVE